MNKTRVIDNKPAQTYSLTWINDNLNNFINGALVSEWILADEYSENFVSPIWNGTEFIEGATPEEIAEANKPIIPIQVKNMKFRLALIKSGIMPSSIDTAITQMPEGAMKENIFTLWNFADYLERNDASLNYMAGQFNITHEQLDNLFILSDTL